MRVFGSVCLALLAGGLAMAQGGFEGPGRYGIFNVGNGKWLQLDFHARNLVVQMSPRPIDSQRWDFQPAEGGLWFVRNVTDGCALEMPRNRNSEPVICGRFDGNPNQMWRLDPANEGSVLIRSRFGRPLDIPSGDPSDGVRIQIYDRNGGANQRFQLQRARRGPDRDHDRDRDRDRDRN
jgi:hypothetical protein